MPRLILFNKPYGVLCQFTAPDPGPGVATSSPRSTLSDFVEVPDVYPAGRLDLDSEGLLLLTDDGRLQARIAIRNTSCPRAIWCRSKAMPTRPRWSRFDGACG